MSSENKKSQTINAYNKSAIALAKKFDDLGVRTDDIIDISTELIKLAQKKVPQGEFLVADVSNFEFPENRK